MNDLSFLKLAVDQAELSVNKGGFPAGAIVVNNGEIVSRGISIGYLLHDPTSHAETASIREACQNLHTSNLNNATLYASLEPCVMCFSVANWSGITRIVYGCRKTKDMVAKEYYEGSNGIDEINSMNSRQIELEYIPDYEQKILSQINDWEKLSNK